jgi:hypothetical protein
MRRKGLALSHLLPGHVIILPSRPSGRMQTSRNHLHGRRQSTCQPPLHHFNHLETLSETLQHFIRVFFVSIIVLRDILRPGKRPFVATSE